MTDDERLQELRARIAATTDAKRPEAVARRRKTGQRTARENLADLLDPGSFHEYGGLAVAAQRQLCRSTSWSGRARRDAAREQLVQHAIAVQTERGGAISMASYVELDAVIDPLEAKKDGAPKTLDQVIAHRRGLLTDYQDAALADRFEQRVRAIAEAEGKRAPGRSGLADAVARGYAKLLAYKDEYEVARLQTDPAFLGKIASQFEGDYKLTYHLAPPLLAKRDAKGNLVKQPFGSWMLTAFRMLAKLKGLRGSAFDIFGRTEERQGERALIAEYRACIEELLTGLTAQRLTQAAEIARIPEEIRGYGHIKERHLKAARPKWDALMQRWRAGDLRKAA